MGDTTTQRERERERERERDRERNERVKYEKNFSERDIRVSEKWRNTVSGPVLPHRENLDGRLR
jgi:hypothetical protein